MGNFVTVLAVAIANPLYYNRPMPIEKTCLDCREGRPHFAHGLCARCYRRQYYANESEKAKMRAKAWQAANPERHRFTRRAIAKRKWAALTPAQKLAKTRRQEKRRSPEERERRKQYQRRYYHEHKAAHTAANKALRRQHPEWRVGEAQRRRARKRLLPATLTREQWLAIKAAYGNRCAYCGLRSQRLTQDHVIPVSKGGGYTPDNIVPACQSCNSRKRAGPPPTFPPVRLMV